MNPAYLERWILLTVVSVVLLTVLVVGIVWEEPLLIGGDLLVIREIVGRFKWF